VNVQRDPYTSKGRMKYYTTKRVGGNVTNFQSMKLLKMAVS
jgi:HK97 family phage major capsid protein